MVRGRLVTRRSTTMPRTATVHAVTAIGVDMGKNTLHMVGLDTRGTIVLREKVSRGRITSRLANLPPCLIGIEAGMATHYVARELAVLGHDVKQVPPAYSKPFRQGQKNDFRDAFAVAEAVQRPTTRFVPRYARHHCVAREGLTRTHYIEACELAALSHWHRSGDGDALRCSRACRAWSRCEAGPARVFEAVSAGAKK